MLVLALISQGAQLDTARFFVTTKLVGPVAQRPVVNQPPPDYPAEAKRRGYEGQVVLAISVSPAGKVAKVRVLASSGYPVLDRAAKRAVLQWRFAEGDWDTGRVAFRFSKGRPRPPDLEASAAPKGRVEAQVRIQGKRSSMPKVLERVLPDYPEDLRRRGVEGKVVVAITLSDGRVEKLQMEEPSCPELNRLALDAAKRWRFSGTGQVWITFIFKIQR